MAFSKTQLMLVFAAVAALSAVVINGQDYEDDVGNGLPGGSDDILSAPYDESFSCEGRDYGYYADVANNCEIFHICLPVEDNEGNVIEYAKWSFVCGNGTVFDQQNLICNHREYAFPCEESESLYGITEFGVIPESK